MQQRPRFAALPSLALSVSLLGTAPARAQLGEVPEAFDHLGAALAAGDFDGNGVADLAIGVPGESVQVWGLYPPGATDYPDAGAAHVLYGTVGDGLTTAGKQFLHQAIGPDQAFGAALAAGDLDADGFTDLLIGIPGRTVSGLAGAGGVSVTKGSANGLSLHHQGVWTQGMKGVGDLAEAGDRFGTSLALGDVDADGFLDLAIGVPLEDVGKVMDAGAVHVLRGSGVIGVLAAGEFWTQAQLEFPEKGDRFGSALAFGDFDGDGFDDLAIGVPYESFAHAQDGIVHVLRGSSTGLSVAGAQIWHQDTPGVEGVAEPDDAFGYALAAADFDKDGFEDLAIGIPNDFVAGVRAGSVNAVFGSPTGLGAAGNLWITQALPMVLDEPEEMDRFGASLTIWELTVSEELYRQLSIGIPGESVDGVPGAGALMIVTLGPGQIGSTHLYPGSFPPSKYAGFGSAAAYADFNGDGFSDICAGAPWMDHLAPQAGAVQVAHSYLWPPQMWRQGP